jgi:lipoprotein-releasing system ATP-binding protein
LENVTMPALVGGTLSPSDTKSRAEETLALLGLDGLEDKNANALSGGQKQRVAIARALMNRPALLLADEPTGNLDTENTAAVYDLFRKVNAETGTAFMIVTHDRSVAQQTDRILEISDGELVQDMRNEYLAQGAPGIRVEKAPIDLTEEQALKIAYHEVHAER